MLGVCRDPRRGRHRAVQPENADLPDHGKHSVTDHARILEVCVVEQHAEFFAAEPADRVVPAQHLPHAATNRAQHPVTDEMPMPIIDLLEVVQVDQQHGCRSLPTVGAGEAAVASSVQAAAVSSPVFASCVAACCSPMIRASRCAVAARSTAMAGISHGVLSAHAAVVHPASSTTISATKSLRMLRIAGPDIASPMRVDQNGGSVTVGADDHGSAAAAPFADPREDLLSLAVA